MSPRAANLKLDTEATLKTDRWIRQLARRSVASESEADDVRQDTWVAALDNPPASRREWKSWLSRVASNAAKRRCRAETRRKRRERMASAKESDSKFPHESLERAELRQQVLRAVLSLREPYRSTVILRYFEELSSKEVARSEGVPLGTVKTRLSRALGLLRAELDQVYHGRKAWALLLAPFLPSATILEAAARTKTGCPSHLSQTGAGLMTTKTVTSATCLSVLAVAAISFGLYRFAPQAQTTERKSQRSEVVLASNATEPVRSTIDAPGARLRVSDVKPLGGGETERRSARSHHESGPAASVSRQSVSEQETDWMVKKDYRNALKKVAKKRART